MNVNNCKCVQHDKNIYLLAKIKDFIPFMNKKVSACTNNLGGENNLEKKKS